MDTVAFPYSRVRAARMLRAGIPSIDRCAGIPFIDRWPEFALELSNFDREMGVDLTRTRCGHRSSKDARRRYIPRPPSDISNAYDGTSKGQRKRLQPARWKNR
jgi:hypothetical protein